MIVVDIRNFSGAFNAIKDHYGDKCAERSKVPYINHIVEGLIILQHLKAHPSTMGAFCLHPLFQDDKDLPNAWVNLAQIKPEGRALLLAMEYRKIANAYLSKRVIKSVDEIELSPLEEVQQMLIADKVQNYKDFELYHAETHERKDELHFYFNNWFERLGVDYQSLKKLIV